MTKGTLEKANELAYIQKAIEKIEDILYIPHPSITDGRTEVCFIGLGETIEKQLKDTIYEFLEKKKEEINKEFDEL